MSRRIIAWENFPQAGLAAAVIFLSLLPALGWTWHRVLPEHEHLFIGTSHDDAQVDAHSGENDCAGCSSSSGSRLHVYSSNAIQVAAIAIEFAPAISLAVPETPSARVDAPCFRLTSPDLPRLDPPPKTD